MSRGLACERTTHGAHGLKTHARSCVLGLVVGTMTAVVQACAPLTRGERPSADANGASEQIAAVPATRAPTQPTDAGVAPDSTEPGAAELERGVWLAANEARRQAGADPLCADARLEDAARAYATELAQRGQLSHESPTRGRETVTARVDAAGGAGWRLVGENLAAVWVRDGDIPGTTIQLWRDSPPHYRNLVLRRYTRVGTGAARGAEHWYIVQLYGDYPPTQRICRPAGHP